MSLERPTTSAPDCDAILDLIPEYAFGLTDAAESQLVEANLHRCPEATHQLEALRALQDEMRADVPQVEPPPELGDRLMAAAAATVAMPAAAITPTPRRTIRFGWVAAAAAILALALSNVYWLARVGSLEARQDELVAMLSDPGGGGAFVLNSTDALRWVRLPGEQPASSASAFMMWNGDSETGLLYARGFPELQPGYQYHVWLTRQGEREFVGILHVDTDGDGALLFHSPEPIDNFVWAWVTAESETADDSPVIVSGEL